MQDRHKIGSMPVYTEILDNPHAGRIHKAASLLRQKNRRETQRFLVEGPQGVREAVRYAPDDVLDVYADVSLSSVNGGTVRQIIEDADAAGIYVHLCTGKTISSISSDSQGILAVVSSSSVLTEADHFLQPDPQHVHAHGGRFYIACWELRDPGNAGTIIRTADAAGCDGVILVGDCVDITNPKVVRSAAGSLFHLPVASMGENEFFDFARSNGITVIAADAYGTPDNPVTELPEAVRVGVGKGSPSSAILFGNEARGLEDIMISRCDEAVRIPLYGKAESLNVAMSVSVIAYTYAMARHVALDGDNCTSESIEQ